MRWEDLTEAEKVLWRDAYLKWGARGYSDKISQYAAYRAVWEQRFNAVKGEM